MYERTAVASACLVRSSLARPPLRPVGRETWWTLPCASCRVPSTRGVFSRTLLWKTGALALSSSFTRGKGRYGHLGVDAGFICTSGPFPYRSSFLPARSTHLRPFGRVTRQTFPSALGLGTVCLALVPLALPLCANPGGIGGRGKSGLSGGSRRGGTCAPLCFVQRATDLPACCLSLASRFPPLGSEEPPPLLCAPTLCFPSPPESKGGGRAIADGPEAV